MRKYLHLTFSFFLSSLFFLQIYSKILSFILSIIVASISTIPDYDYKIYSWANRNIMILQKSFLKYILFPYYLLLKALVKIFKHRTTTHNLNIVVILFLISRILRGFLRLFFFLISFAFLLHILGDIFTVSGVPLFYPFSKKTFKIPLINTRKDIIKQQVLSALLLFVSLLLYIL